MEVEEEEGVDDWTVILVPDLPRVSPRGAI